MTVRLPLPPGRDMPYGSLAAKFLRLSDAMDAGEKPEPKRTSPDREPLKRRQVRRDLSK